MGNSAHYNAEWRARVGDKFKFYGIEYSNRRAIEHLYKRYKPALVVYDQIDKLQGFEADREDLVLGAKYQFAREMCKVSGAAIGVTQADGTAEGVKYLTMNHTANSKTSKAAEGDFIFGIGKTHSEAEEDIRYINICKNKLIGDTDSIPALRHGRAAVFIKPAVMRYEDIMSNYG
jgi:hypothetical protein